MNVKAFIDTNIFVYAAIQAADSLAKRESAVALLNSPTRYVVSTQVLNEFAAVLLKKKFSDKLIRTRVESIANECSIAVVDMKTIRLGWDLRQRYNLSLWGSLIAASALIAKCTILYTEDMQNGLLIDNSLHVVNPF
ncbi:PIN domain-containing protein [Trichlorobacter lovleyi]|uniref:PIN domain-containing protein n=1 Tax=Trichlorobacter lovleyi TaxID=313985 RepID=UPI002480EEEA|nr:PIN domain-containing protein [Trichlorobacter lovleyi]